MTLLPDCACRTRRIFISGSSRDVRFGLFLHKDSAFPRNRWCHSPKRRVQGVARVDVGERNGDGDIGSIATFGKIATLEGTCAAPGPAEGEGP